MPGESGLWVSPGFSGAPQSTTIPNTKRSMPHTTKMRLIMQVSEILAIKGKVLYTIAPNRSLSEAVAIMTEQDVGSLVVFEHGKMVGMLTFREVLKAVNDGGVASTHGGAPSALPAGHGRRYAAGGHFIP
jgi:predicted transcriptional regulator